MKEIGVAVIGYGIIGKVHTYAYQNLPFFYSPSPARIRLEVVCTSQAATAEAAREAGGFKSATTDFRAAISRPGVDVVNICSPNNLHKEHLLAAIAAGKHIYCDKPLTATWAEAAEIGKALENYKGVSQMTLNYRFLLCALRARQLVEEGFLGRVIQFRAVYLHSGSVDPDKPIGWKQKAGAGGGVINDLASHVADIVDWLIGPITDVMANSVILHARRPDGRGGKVAVDAEDSVAILARVASGASGMIEASKIATGIEDELRVEIHGTAGALRFNAMNPNFLEAYSLAAPDAPLGGMRGWTRIDTVNRYPAPAGWPAPKLAVGWLRSHVHCLHEFIAAVVAGRPARPDLRDGVRLQYLLEQVRSSAAAQAWRRVERATG